MSFGLSTFAVSCKFIQLITSEDDYLIVSGNGNHNSCPEWPPSSITDGQRVVDLPPVYLLHLFQSTSATFLSSSPCFRRCHWFLPISGESFWMLKCKLIKIYCTIQVTLIPETLFHPVALLRHIFLLVNDLQNSSSVISFRISLQSKVVLSPRIGMRMTRWTVKDSDQRVDRVTPSYPLDAIFDVAQFKIR